MSERMIGRGLSELRIGACQCPSCTHVSETLDRCQAFPGGIPAPILAGAFIHDKPYPGDHGIRFEPRANAKED